MRDPEPQVAAGKVLWHFTMSLDGFVAGPDHAMDWMTGFTGRDGIVAEYVETTGAVLGGRDGWGRFPDPSATYGGAWQGQLLERGLIDEIDLHVAPILLGDGIRLYDNPGGSPIRLALQQGDEPDSEVDLRYRVVTR